MNKIEVIDKNKIINDFEDHVLISINQDTLELNFIENIEQKITLINDLYKKIIININKNSYLEILEIKEDTKLSNYEYQYNIDSNSKLVINKFYCLDNYYEENNINLCNEESLILFNLSTICHTKQKYIININHNHKKTSSYVYNRGITINNGDLEFIINGKVEKGMSESVLNQDSKIINIDDGRGNILPNFYIDENDIEARHGASIGSFNKDELFYLESRGIKRQEAYNLLIKGFLLGRMHINDLVKNKLEEIINNNMR